MPDENDPTIPDEGENQLAEQHPTNGGNLSRPDERENQLAEQHPTNRDHLSRPDERENQLTEPKLRSILPIGSISPDRG